MDHSSWWRCICCLQVCEISRQSEKRYDSDCVYVSDAVAAHGFAHELANYGEYSGAPIEGQTYEYTKTISAYTFLLQTVSLYHIFNI